MRSLVAPMLLVPLLAGCIFGECSPGDNYVRGFNENAWAAYSEANLTPPPVYVVPREQPFYQSHWYGGHSEVTEIPPLGDNASLIPGANATFIIYQTSPQLRLSLLLRSDRVLIETAPSVKAAQVEKLLEPLAPFFVGNWSAWRENAMAAWQDAPLGYSLELHSKAKESDFENEGLDFDAVKDWIISQSPQVSTWWASTHNGPPEPRAADAVLGDWWIRYSMPAGRVTIDQSTSDAWQDRTTATLLFVPTGDMLISPDRGDHSVQELLALANDLEAEIGLSGTTWLPGESYELCT